jgi:hypothetical protein
MEDLNGIFQKLRSLLAEYEPPLKTKSDTVRSYELQSVKDLVILDRKMKGVYFASAIIQKAYVGFYYMPVYADPGVKSNMDPRLLKLLKGKSCFHIKHLDDDLMEVIKNTLASGFKEYQRRGWV